MDKITDTHGMFDLSGEEIEGWEVGDQFKLADHAEPVVGYDRDHVFTVSLIEIDRDHDFNNFVLYAVDGGRVTGVHRMDASRV